MIKHIAVLGAGTMGAQIAAHLANAGFAPLLLDLPDATDRNRIARQGLERVLKLSPAPLFIPEFRERIRVGNFEDDLARLAGMDWIIEAVAEDLEIKRSLLGKVEQVRAPACIVSSNTSGLPLELVARQCSAEFRKAWLGTHFFNPPRYMKLLEIIPTEETSAEVVSSIAAFAERHLGKGVVRAKDTPNFIANRIGTFGSLLTKWTMIEQKLTIEEVDTLTGPLVGRPKSATFRTGDLVGLDVLAYVARNTYQNAPQDEQRELFVLPEFIEAMLSRKWLGDKTGSGFYRKSRSQGETVIETLDYGKLEYRPFKKPNLGALAPAAAIEDPAARIRQAAQTPGPMGEFVWKTLSRVLLYAAHRIPEISDDIINVDRAMRWGYNWEFGPFETWDLLGVPAVADRLAKEGCKLPPLVEAVLGNETQSFYRRANGATFHFLPSTAQFVRLDEPAGTIVLKSVKESGGVIRRNAGASLVDLGDGVLGLEFHSKLNSIGADTVSMMNLAVQEAEKNFAALVVANQGQHFSAGANLLLLLLEAQEGNWDEIDQMVRGFQKANLQLRACSRPVVVAPFGLALGGGCEIVLHGDAAQASAETYIGLVEVGVGLIPAGGGTKEMAARAAQQARAAGSDDLVAFLRPVFENIAMARTSSSAEEAKKLGYLRQADGVSMNRDRLVADARQVALALTATYRPTPERPRIPVAGPRALGLFDLSGHLMNRAGFASDYDVVIARKVARILCGGDLAGPAEVDEQYLLDLEREAFLSLCGQRKTQERIQHMLKKGKPLRN
ncbi:MAG: 3-hydroxyacyl-CoA dehydrogenase/enoyl-CoA hydratase family protein [Acidobacteriota bacterium]